MTAIGRKSFEIYVDEMKRMVDNDLFVEDFQIKLFFKSKSPERNKNLEKQCQFFMIKRVHVRKEVQEEAKLYLHQLLSKNAFV